MMQNIAKTNDNKSSARSLYLSIIETLGVIILASMLASIIYGGLKIAREAKNVGGKVSDFNTQVNQINTNLKNINNKLQTVKTVAP